MQNKNKNNKHFQIGSALRPLMILAVFLPSAVMAQAFPALPPLPSLPGMEAPPATAKVEKAVEEVKAVAKKAEETLAEVPKMDAMPPIADVTADDMFAAPAAANGVDEMALPDFGLFDPAALEPPTEVEPAKAVAEAPKLELPTMDAPAAADVAAATDFSDMFEAPELPDLPIMPDFDTAEVPEPKMADAPKKGDDLTEIAAPKLPENKPAEKELVDALPSWVTDETLPSLKPMPQQRNIPAVLPKMAKSDQNISDQKSLADLIDKEINSGDNYTQDSASIDDIPLDDDAKRVVWPNNFKTQTLPPEVYKKQYSNANRHLPHALYKKEIEAHLFGAVGANDADAVRALLRTGVPLNVRNTMGEDLTMHAVKAGATTTLQLVLALGATPSQQDRYGATPLHRAVFLGRQDMATILLRAGANSYVNDMSGVTPMAIAVARQDQPMMQTLGYYQSSGKSNQNMAQFQPY